MGSLGSVVGGLLIGIGVTLAYQGHLVLGLVSASCGGAALLVRGAEIGYARGRAKYEAPDWDAWSR